MKAEIKQNLKNAKHVNHDRAWHFIIYRPKTNRITPKEITPTMTMTNKFLEIIAAITVGTEARKFPHSIDGSWPMC